jgi:Fe2+ or Zn2+ uptake regulation protein
MTCAEHLSDEIRKRGFRLTPQRMAILHILTEDGGHLTPAQVF